MRDVLFNHRIPLQFRKSGEWAGASGARVARDNGGSAVGPKSVHYVRQAGRHLLETGTKCR